jgi:hypothetical protein
MDHPELAGILVRVNQLERHLRMVVIGWLLSLLALVVWGLATREVAFQPTTSQQYVQADLIKAREIHVTDTAGRIRVYIDGERISLRDPENHERILLRLFQDGYGPPVLWFFDSRMQPRISLSLDSQSPEEDPHLVLFDSRGRIRFLAP